MEINFEGLKNNYLENYFVNKVLNVGIGGECRGTSDGHIDFRPCLFTSTFE